MKLMSSKLLSFATLSFVTLSLVACKKGGSNSEAFNALPRGKAFYASVNMAEVVKDPTLKQQLGQEVAKFEAENGLKLEAVENLFIAGDIGGDFDSSAVIVAQLASQVGNIENLKAKLSENKGEAFNLVHIPVGSKHLYATGAGVTADGINAALSAKQSPLTEGQQAVLSHIDSSAVIWAVGNVPADLAAGAGVPVKPTNFALSVNPSGSEMKIEAAALFGTADEAKAAVALIEQGIGAAKMMAPEEYKSTIDSVKFSQKGSAVALSAKVSKDLAASAATSL